MRASLSIAYRPVSPDGLERQEEERQTGHQINPYDLPPERLEEPSELVRAMVAVGALRHIPREFE